MANKSIQSYSLITRWGTALVGSITIGLATCILPTPGVASDLTISQRQSDWEALLEVARLVNARQEVTDLVLQLDLLDKPETTYANAVYQVFARIDGRWEEIYTNIGARLITGQAGRVTLEPEVIPIQELRDRLEQESLDLSDLDLRVSVQIRYDLPGGRRDQRLEFEQVQAYSAIAQTTTVEIITVATNPPCVVDCDGDIIDEAIDIEIEEEIEIEIEEEVITEETVIVEEVEGETDVVTLSNGYRVTFLGVSYAGSNSIWRYYVEELPIAQDLSNWVLELPSCARVVDASPRGELVNPDPNARLNGIKWQPGGGFVEGEFSVTLSGQLTVGRIQVAVKGPDVAWGELAGPSCGSY
jgi:hypothetical protein